ncbi:MAG: O-antigen ligase family protein [Candidatus Polarisedimenticolia bacterium]
MGAAAPAARRAWSESVIVAFAAAGAAMHLSLSSQPLESMRVMAGFASGGMAFLYCARTSEAGSRRAVQAGIILAGTLLALHGVWQAAGGFRMMAEGGGEALPDALRARLAAGRAVAGLGLPGALGGFLILSLPLTWGWLRSAMAKTPRGPWVVVAAVALLAQAAGLAATRSAAAMAALGLSIAVVMWRRAPAGRRRLVLWPLVVALPASVAMLVWRMASDPLANPFLLRAGNWKAALAIMADHPLFGAGLGCFGIVFPAYRDWGMNESRHAHNVWLELAAEAGLPAALAAVALASWLLWRLLGRGSESRVSPFVATSCTAFLAHNTVDFTLYLPGVALAFFCLAGAECGRREPGAGSLSISLRPVAAAALAALVLLVAHGDVRRVSALDLALSGQVPEAAEAAQGAVRANPLDPASHALLSRLMVESGDLEGAERHAVRAVELDEQTPGHWHHLGRVRLARSDPQGAYIALHRAAQLYPIQLEYRADRDAVARLLERAPEGGS